ncbi:unnamed protein product [Prorocentrum cordatum]|uniref:Peptidyl-prolyl cis-trans isomerase n=1 Tax=Prorocentrum cordatum TaxID=2364126 RepID=A0ABN9UEF3_9DINO|nr:unnamed protein product [Polarella glacialis]
MASFGRKPARQGRQALAGASAPRDGPAGGAEDKSDALRRLLREEAEREKYAEEFAARGEREREEARRAGEAQAQQRRAHEEVVQKWKGRPNPIVFLDVQVRGPGQHVLASGRLEIELFADQVPITAENFRCLCTGERGRTPSGPGGGRLHYKLSKFHRVVPGFMAQGGDITHGDGTGGLSIYGPTFLDENFKRLHSRCNLLSMANSGPDSNNSQFFVLFKQCKHLDRKHVVFGEIVREDGGVMKRIESIGSEDGSVDGQILITNCGELAGAEDEQRRRHASIRGRRSTVS